MEAFEEAGGLVFLAPIHSCLRWKPSQRPWPGYVESRASALTDFLQVGWVRIAVGPKTHPAAETLGDWREQRVMQAPMPSSCACKLGAKSSTSESKPKRMETKREGKPLW